MNLKSLMFCVDNLEFLLRNSLIMAYKSIDFLGEVKRRENTMGPGFLRGVRFPSILILALLVVFLFIFYKPNPAAEVKTNVSQLANSIQVNKHQQNFSEVHLNLAQVIIAAYGQFIFLRLFHDNSSKFLWLTFRTLAIAVDKIQLDGGHLWGQLGQDASR
jgi:hypothetical protein